MTQIAPETGAISQHPMRRGYRMWQPAKPLDTA